MIVDPDVLVLTAFTSIKIRNCSIKLCPEEEIVAPTSMYFPLSEGSDATLE